MTNEIISYLEMCTREGANLQQGMNFRLGKKYSVILMSVRPNAPYRDRYEDDGSTLIYEGHDQPRSRTNPDPKNLDQLEMTQKRKLTQNGKFIRSAKNYQKGLQPPELVRVYEKIREGIWSYNGVFQLVDAWQEFDSKRFVFKLKLIAINEDESYTVAEMTLSERRRVIPTSVKPEVWKRDHGQCVLCGARDELHFDHILPYSKGGTSVKAENVQLLCARHNLEKHDKIA